LGVVFNWNAFTSLWKPAKREDPGVVAERWVQALEDEVGALTWARLRAAEVAPDSVKEIPDFYLGSYGDVLNTAKRELKILCVVLVSDEHDDVPRFKQ
jgi:FAS-associated factor 2